ncbi:MAG: hypothetical protein VB086_11185 [Clostridiaceae bacterium]|nr:hypothetical protein [Clostridiaceae bacterium]
MAVLLSVFVGCTRNEEESLPLRTYTFEASDDPVKPNITLAEDGKFTFVFSSLSSYIGRGSYSINGSILELQTEDGKYHYAFDIADEELAFNAEDSSSMTWFSNITDGDIFK